jgi:hypothetical protein
MRKTVRKWDLDRDILFNTRVTGAYWQEWSSQWKLTVEHEGIEREEYADILISAQGFLRWDHFLESLHCQASSHNSYDPLSPVPCAVCSWKLWHAITKTNEVLAHTNGRTFLDCGIFKVNLFTQPRGTTLMITLTNGLP